MRRALLLLIFLLGGVAGAVRTPTAAPAQPVRQPPPAAITPVPFAQVVGAALGYARTVRPEHAGYVRFVDFRAFDDARRRRAVDVVTWHLNSISSEPLLFRPVEVCECVYAFNLKALDATNPDRLVKVWEDLARVNPYYCVGVDEYVTAYETVKKTRKVNKYFPAGVNSQTGRPYPAGNYDIDEEYEEKVEKKDATKATRKYIPAAGKIAIGGELRELWLPPAETAALVNLVGSATPIVPAELFYNETSAQEDQREGHGYYDWFGFKTRDDIEKFARFDRKGSREHRQELFAIQRFSGVANNNRQTFAYEAAGGYWFESHDCDFSRDFYDYKLLRVVRKNGWTNYYEDFEHVAEEHIWRLRNGLPGGSASDNKGKLVKSVPPQIASNRHAVSNDMRIDTAYSCWECHDRSGLRAFRCDLRAHTDPRTALSVGALLANDPARARIEYGATGPIYQWFARAEAGYAQAVQDSCGLDWETVTAYARELKTNYLYRPVSLRQAAADAGWDPVKFHARLVQYATYKDAKGLVVDPVVSTLLIPNGPGLRRDHWEDRFSLIMVILGGAHP